MTKYRCGLLKVKSTFEGTMRVLCSYCCHSSYCTVAAEYLHTTHKGTLGLQEPQWYFKAYNKGRWRNLYVYCMKTWFLCCLSISSQCLSTYSIWCLASMKQVLTNLLYSNSLPQGSNFQASKCCLVCFCYNIRAYRLAYNHYAKTHAQGRNRTCCSQEVTLSLKAIAVQYR